jgi:hypothetical protein
MSDGPFLNTDSPKNCSCHPDDRVHYGIKKCPRLQALTECRIATLEATVTDLNARISAAADLLINGQ